MLGLGACGSGSSADRDALAAALPPSVKPVPMGVYAGASDAQQVATFEQRLGRRMDRVHDYLDKRTWRRMTQLRWMTSRWERGGFSNRLVLTVPMLPDRGKGTLAQGAAGRFNQHFRKIAEGLVKGGQRRAVLGIGPEFNGKWFRWSIAQPRGGRLYAAYFRQIVKTMRSVRGARFKFDWSPNAGSAYVDGGRRQLSAGSAYPGNAFVDYIGLDIFDHSWAPGSASPKARWREFLSMKNGLAWHARFAARHNKPMSFPEWGLSQRPDGRGGGDNPYFVRKMFEWVQTHRVAYHVYFEAGDPDADSRVFSGTFPRAAESFVTYFGASAEASAAALAAGK